MSTTRFADAIAGLLAVYTAAPGLAGIPVYDGTQPAPSEDPAFLIVGHDGSMTPEGALQTTALAGNYLQEWVQMEGSGPRQERGSINCLIVSQTSDTTDMAGRRAQAALLLAAAEDAAAAGDGYPPGISGLTFDGSTDGRFIYWQGTNGIAVLAVFRMSYSAPW